jgi:retron-type reverse transcriptase
MLAILAEKIHDGRFLRLIGHMLKAGYLEDWRWHATLSGSPQGGIASPVLSNIYLDRLDQYVEQRLLPELDGRRLETEPTVTAPAAYPTAPDPAPGDGVAPRQVV